jgi:glutathione S-transferase
MTAELVFYTNPMSRGRTVRWMLEELGVPYRTEILEFGTTMKSPEYLAVNPMGKVPAIRHGEAVVTESAAIYTLESAVTKSAYIAGERFSAADVYCGSHLGMGLRFGAIESRPSFEEYWERVSDRPAYRRATQLDDALVPKQA